MSRCRLEIRSRALRAAARVALLGGVLGCETPTRELSQPEQAVETARGAHETHADAGPRERPDANEHRTDASSSDDLGDPSDAGNGLPDSRDVLADARELGTDAGEASADAGTVCDSTDSDAWLACCELIGWDWQRGCAAWGPPVPPAAVRSKGREVAA
ncbi:MAG: hypothetical protein HYV07_05485 [Deltaproteobacteria bacterium]|nr:hypothetical protein [Deltaproteobacteria bacterium]